MASLASALIGATLLGVAYFDAHNHITGVLPYQAYANLPAYVSGFPDPQAAVGVADRLALYRYLADVWYPAKGAALGSTPFSPAGGQRFAMGARAAIVVYRRDVAGSVAALDGTLERVLTATPWTEFDSAYAFRGGPAYSYLRERFYGGSDTRLEADLCAATVLELARTNIAISEQSMPFLGGWRFESGASAPLQTIECVMGAAADARVRSGLRAMNKPLPSIAIVLMTHTAQLAELPDGRSYDEWSKTGTCRAVALPRVLVTTPKAIYEALMGWNAGKAVVAPAQARQYYDDVVGIDTAAPETTCFTAAGMSYYERLIAAVYDAAKARRLAGWHGKLLVHTHVGEGAIAYYSPTPPEQPWTFQNLFAALPPARTNPDQARENISTLLRTIGEFESAHPDVHDYVIFRLAHATWATPEQAQTMRDEGVETDVNLESNVATGAYPIARMPLGSAAVASRIAPLAQNPAANFKLNDLLGTLVANAADSAQVGDVLGNVSLKYMLEARVRCILGTDADGVEHSDIVREYEYAASLIAYWNHTDPQFRARSAGAAQATLFENAAWHRANMAADRALTY